MQKQELDWASVQLPKALKRRGRQRAAEEDISFSEVVRRGLLVYLEQPVKREGSEVKNATA